MSACVRACCVNVVCMGIYKNIYKMYLYPCIYLSGIIFHISFGYVFNFIYYILLVWSFSVMFYQ